MLGMGADRVVSVVSFQYSMQRVMLMANRSPVGICGCNTRWSGARCESLSKSGVFWHAIAACLDFISCTSQDLFFALRGGGGGTFAVVLSATTRADPRVTIQAVLVQYPPELQIKGGFESGDNKGDLGRDGHKPEDSLALTRSFWSVLITHALRWAHEGWGGYVNANSALYLNPVLGKEESQESMRELVEWGQRLKASAGELGSGVVVLQGEYGSWGHFFSTFADANSAVSPILHRCCESNANDDLCRTLASHLLSHPVLSLRHYSILLRLVRNSWTLSSLLSEMRLE